MKNQINKIMEIKSNYLNKLKEIQVEYLSTIYSGFIEKKSVRDIHKDIRKVSIYYSNLGIDVNMNTERYAMALTKKLNKKIDVIGLTPVAISTLVFRSFSKEEAYQQMSSLNYEKVSKLEEKMKNKMLKEELKKNRSLEKAKVFYLASSHDDCAIDHQDFQGLIYVDEEWRKYVKNEQAIVEIRKYINENNVRTFQWVTGSPVWFITRPNCRHYFKALSTIDVLNKSLDVLKEENGTHTSVGSRETQTIRHPINKGWYTKKNIKDIIRKYKERLKYHQALYKKFKNDEILNAINKDKLMIEKWEKYLQTI